MNDQYVFKLHPTKEIQAGRLIVRRRGSILWLFILGFKVSCYFRDIYSIDNADPDSDHNQGISWVSEARPSHTACFI
jgi:hypothetical protein